MILDFGWEEGCALGLRRILAGRKRNAKVRRPQRGALRAWVGEILGMAAAPEGYDLIVSLSVCLRGLRTSLSVALLSNGPYLFLPTSNRREEEKGSRTRCLTLAGIVSNHHSTVQSETMKWTVLLVIAAMIVIVFLLKRGGEIPAAEARDQLQQGAVVIDVRSPGEYNGDHLQGAINIPLDVIESAVPQRVQDKSQVLLLHCQSGVRSAMAMRKLKAIGYTNVFNLGSLERARDIVGKTRP